MCTSIINFLRSFAFVAAFAAYANGSTICQQHISVTGETTMALPCSGSSIMTTQSTVRFYDNFLPDDKLVSLATSISANKADGGNEVKTYILIEDAVKNSLMDALRYGGSTSPDSSKVHLCPAKIALGDSPDHVDHAWKDNEKHSETLVLYLRGSAELILTNILTNEETHVAVKPGRAVVWSNDHFTHSARGDGSERIMLGPMAIDNHNDLTGVGYVFPYCGSSGECASDPVLKVCKSAVLGPGTCVECVSDSDCTAPDDVCEADACEQSSTTAAAEDDVPSDAEEVPPGYIAAAVLAGVCGAVAIGLTAYIACSGSSTPAFQPASGKEVEVI